MYVIVVFYVKLSIESAKSQILDKPYIRLGDILLIYLLLIYVTVHG